MPTYNFTFDYSAGNDEEIIFSVKHVSNCNSSSTTIMVPYSPKPLTIKNEGFISLGKAELLRKEPTFVSSQAVNVVSSEDEIKIDYMINGKVVCSFAGKKENDETPAINIQLKFPKKSMLRVLTQILKA